MASPQYEGHSPEAIDPQKLADNLCAAVNGVGVLYPLVRVVPPTADEPAYQITNSGAQEEGEAMFLAKIKPAGNFGFDTYPIPEDLIVTILDIQLPKDGRGHGAGTALFDAWESTLKAAGVRAAFVDTVIKDLVSDGLRWHGMEHFLRSRGYMNINDKTGLWIKPLI